MSMTESMEEMKNEAKESARAKQIMKTRKKAKEVAALKNVEAGDGDTPKMTPLKRSLTFKSGKKIKPDVRSEVKLKKVLSRAWEGIEILDLLSVHDDVVRNAKTRCCPKSCWIQYWEISKVSERFSESSCFVNFITIVICIAGVMLGIQTDINENNNNFASCSLKNDCAKYEYQYEVEHNESLQRRAVAGGYKDDCLHWDTYIFCPDGCYEKSTPIQVLEVRDFFYILFFFLLFPFQFFILHSSFFLLWSLTFIYLLLLLPISSLFTSSWTQ